MLARILKNSAGNDLPTFWPKSGAPLAEQSTLHHLLGGNRFKAVPRLGVAWDHSYRDSPLLGNNGRLGAGSAAGGQNLAESSHFWGSGSKRHSVAALHTAGLRKEDPLCLSLLATQKL